MRIFFTFRNTLVFLPRRARAGMALPLSAAVMKNTSHNAISTLHYAMYNNTQFTYHVMCKGNCQQYCPLERTVVMVC